MVAHDTVAHLRDDPSLDRIGAFSDAVFAFAITLLILAIRIPQPADADAGQGLLALLTQQWRSYLASSRCMDVHPVDRCSSLRERLASPATMRSTTCRTTCCPPTAWKVRLASR
jgi:hypothetical protein